MTSAVWSEAPEALVHLAELLKCTICGNHLTNPYTTTDCDHHFCRKCIVQVLGKTSKCPECGHCAWVKSLRKNPQMEGIVSCCSRLNKIVHQSVPAVQLMRFNTDSDSDSDADDEREEAEDDSSMPMETGVGSRKRPAEKTRPNTAMHIEDEIETQDPNGASFESPAGTKSTPTPAKSSATTHRSKPEAPAPPNARRLSSAAKSPSRISSAVSPSPLSALDDSTASDGRHAGHGSKTRPPKRAGSVIVLDGKSQDEMLASDTSAKKATTRAAVAGAAARGGGGGGAAAAEEEEQERGSAADSSKKLAMLRSKRPFADVSNTASPKAGEKAPEIAPVVKRTRSSSTRKAGTESSSASEDSSLDTDSGKPSTQGGGKSRRAWSCEMCTFENPLPSLTCEVCSTPKRVSSNRVRDMIAQQQGKIFKATVASSEESESESTSKAASGAKPAKASARQAVTVKKEKAHEPTSVGARAFEFTSSPLSSAVISSGQSSQTSLSSSPGRKSRRNRNGETALHLAAMKGQLDRMKLLLQDGADPDEQDNAGWTPLHEACNHGQAEAVSLLLEHGANVNAPGFESMTPLHDTVTVGFEHIAEILLQFGANPLARNEAGMTPLDLCSSDSMRKVLAAHYTPRIIARKPVQDALAASSISSSPASSHPESQQPSKPPVPASGRKQLRSTPEALGGAASSGGLQASRGVVILSTGLRKEQKETLQKCVKSLGGRIISDFDAGKVTHVITVTDADRLSPRTLKYICAVLSGVWIVSFDWIAACVKRNEWVNEGAFEIRGDSLCLGAPAKGRQRALLSQPKLFDGLSFYLKGAFSPPSLSKSDVQLLIKSGDGKLLPREPIPANTKVRAVGDAAHFPFRKVIIEDTIQSTSEGRVEGDVYVASVTWLLDCVSQFKLFVSARGKAAAAAAAVAMTS